MCNCVNDTMMVMLIVTEIRQLNILLKCYVYKKCKETLSDIHVCANIKLNMLWLPLGWPHLWSVTCGAWKNRAEMCLRAGCRGELGMRVMFQLIVKVRGCAWWGAEFISLRIPTNGGTLCTCNKHRFTKLRTVWPAEFFQCFKKLSD